MTTPADRVLLDIERQSEEKPLIIIGPKRGKVLDDVMLRYRPKKVLEIGTLVGYSAIRMGRFLPSGGTVTCIEMDATVAEVARANIARAGLGSVIVVEVGDAREVIPTLKERFEMVFIDAEKVEYLDYLRLIERRLPNSAVVVADNVKRFAADVQDYLHHVRESGRYSSAYIESESAFDPENGDAVEVSVKLTDPDE